MIWLADALHPVTPSVTITLYVPAADAVITLEVDITKLIRLYVHAHVGRDADVVAVNVYGLFEHNIGTTGATLIETVGRLKKLTFTVLVALQPVRVLITVTTNVCGPTVPNGGVPTLMVPELLVDIGVPLFFHR